MGNCQAAEAATVVIQHPGNKIERIYWSVSVHQIMNSNPGHYVALVIPSPSLKSQNGMPLKQLKLLRPHDTLLIGHVYRLISFQGMLYYITPTSKFLIMYTVYYIYVYDIHTCTQRAFSVCVS